MVARRAHNPKVVGSSPASATTKEQVNRPALFSSRVITRRATLVGAKRYAAAGGGYRRDAEVRKQGELRNAPSEQGDCVFEGQARQSLVRLTRRSLVQVQPPQPQRSRSIDLLFFSSRVMTRQATLVGAKRYAAGGGYRRDAEVRKQGELRNAPSEQGDCVFEGQARQSLARLTRRSLVQVQPPQPQKSRSIDLLFFCLIHTF